jgi:hypothetical protein
VFKSSRTGQPGHRRSNSIEARQVSTVLSFSVLREKDCLIEKHRFWNTV